MERIKACWARVRRAQEGMEAVEGMIILTLLIFILTMFLSFGFLLYQQWVVTSVANDTAARIAQSYSYPDADPVMGYIHRTMKLTMSPFRYMSSRLENKNADKGEKYALWSLDQVGFAYPNGEPEVQVRTVHDSFAQRHVEVEIRATYEIPFGGALAYFGMDKTVTYHATGYAPCVDISNYLHSVDTLSSLSKTNFGSKVLGAVDSVLAAIQKIANSFAS